MNQSNLVILILPKTYSSEVRRNKKCVHLIYGVDISVNAGNMMYFAPLHALLKSAKYTDA